MRGADLNAGGLIGASAGAVSEEQAGERRFFVPVSEAMIEAAVRECPDVPRETVVRILSAALVRR